MKLNELMNEFHTRSFVLADDGQGCGFGEAGRTVEYGEEHKEYGEQEMFALDDPHMSKDGSECLYASDWIVEGEGEGDNPYRVRIYF